MAYTRLGVMPTKFSQCNECFVGTRDRTCFNAGKSDGTPRKLLDVSRIKALGWEPRVPLLDGIEETYRWFVKTEAERARVV